jgi:hypothetical protein
VRVNQGAFQDGDDTLIKLHRLRRIWAFYGGVCPVSTNNAAISGLSFPAGQHDSRLRLRWNR